MKYSLWKQTNIVAWKHMKMEIKSLMLRLQMLSVKIRYPSSWFDCQNLTRKHSIIKSCHIFLNQCFLFNNVCYVKCFHIRRYKAINTKLLYQWISVNITFKAKFTLFNLTCLYGHWALTLDEWRYDSIQT